MFVAEVELNLTWKRLRLLASIAQVTKHASAPRVYLAVLRKSKCVGVGAGDVSDRNVVESVCLQGYPFVISLMVEDDTLWTLLVFGEGWETKLKVVIATQE